MSQSIVVIGLLTALAALVAALEIIEVSTSEQLAAAVFRNHRVLHIVVREHLRLRTDVWTKFPRADTLTLTVCFYNALKTQVKSLIVLFAGFLLIKYGCAVQGRCKQPPDWPLLHLQTPWKLGQCILYWDSSLNSYGLQLRNVQWIWIDSIYMMDTGIWFAGADTYMTAVSIQEGFVATLSDGDSMLFADVEIVGTNRSSSSPIHMAVLDQASSFKASDDNPSSSCFSAANSSFRDNRVHAGNQCRTQARSYSSCVAAVLESWMTVRIENCTFVNNTGGTFEDIRTFSDAALYSDDSVLAYERSKYEDKGPGLPQIPLSLDKVPSGLCPTLQDAKFVRIKELLEAALPPLTVEALPAVEPPPAMDPPPVPTALIAGSMAGGLAVLLAVGVLIMYLRRTRNRQRQSRPEPTSAKLEGFSGGLRTSPETDAVIGLRVPVQSLDNAIVQADWVTMTQWHGGETEPFHAKVACGTQRGRAEFITMSDCTATQTKASMTHICGYATGDVPSGGTCQVSVVMKRAPTVDALDDALDGMYARQEPLLGRWQVLNATQRRVGGQGIVQFVKDTATGEEAVFKFFLNALAFQREAVLYAQEDVREVMAAVKDVQDNTDGALTTSNGEVVFPPFIVLEKGRSLNEWALITQPDFATSIQVLVQIVDRLRQLHALDVVHRDLKPANILWRSTVGQWTLIDFGCAVAAGSDAIISCTIPYAPPEVAQAIKEKRTTLKADPSMDIWALGVMIYEMLARMRAFGTGGSMHEIVDKLTGPNPLPWEAGSEHAHRMRKLGIVRKVVCACLERDPEKRPTSEDLLCSLDSLFYQTTQAQTQSAPHM